MSIKDKSFGVIPVKYIKNEYYFLILQHKSSGQRDFPKGHAEEGETEIQTAKRELSEETGIKEMTIFEGEKFENRYFVKLDGKTTEKTVVFFVGFLEREENINIPKKEIKDYLRCDYNKTLETITDNAKNVLKQVNQFLLNR